METILLLVFVFFIAYQLGISVTAYRLRHLIFKEARSRGIKVENTLDEDKPLTITQCWVEKIQDTLYLYDLSENEFICQAKTMEDLAELAFKYKDVKLATVLFDNKYYSFRNGKVDSTA